MSLKKSIKHGKDYREEYRGAKAIDPTCRNHGSDHISEANRLFGSEKRIQKCTDQQKRYEEYAHQEMSDIERAYAEDIE